jgi:hypothetical protein
MLINQTKTYYRVNMTGEIAKSKVSENEHFNHQYIFALKTILAAF